MTKLIKRILRLPFYILGKVIFYPFVILSLIFFGIWIIGRWIFTDYSFREVLKVDFRDEFKDKLYLTSFFLLVFGIIGGISALAALGSMCL
jgi:hypothetical protein